MSGEAGPRLLTPADAPRPPAGIENIIIIDNVPSIAAAKVDKLKNVIKKVLSPVGVVNRIELPMNEETGKTAGFCFVEFATKDQAIEAKASCDGYRLDKKHVFTINNMSDFDKYLNTPESWEQPNDDEFEEKENLQSWLMHAHCQDQFVIRADLACEVHWCRKNDSVSSYSKSKWTDTYVAWSPKGSYLATFHRQGIALWGGKKWKGLQRFAHPQVKLIDFSPSETYLVTWSDQATFASESVIVWDIKGGDKMRAFDFKENPEWPALKWSHDDKYLARMKEDHSQISFFSTPSMTLLDKKHLKIKDVQDFQWSPTDNIISYWIPEDGDQPARVCLMEMPSRTIVKSSNIFQVKECKMSWQKNGDHLCVSVERWTKSKKATYTQFMLFHLRGKLIAMDVVEIKEAIQHFDWEPLGSKFAVVFGEQPKIALSVYTIAGGKVTLLKTIERITANTLAWSPRGRHLVVAGLGQMQGVLEFIDTNDMTTMSTGEHFMAGELEWDPTGRYVVSSVSFWRHQNDTGFYVWSFQGKLLQRVLRDKFYQILWRPRPPTLLTTKNITDISKNIKRYQSQFEAQDKLQMTRESDDVLEKRRALMDRWEAFQEDVKYRKERYASVFAALRPEENAEEGVQTDIEETFEVFVREEVEVLDVKIK